eukprot:superscaffoldBa00003684_g17488
MKLFQNLLVLEQRFLQNLPEGRRASSLWLGLRLCLALLMPFSETKGLDHSDGFYAGIPIPCADSYAGFCVHGTCEIKYNMATCRCDSGYKGPQCDEPQDFNILYVVPSGQKLHYVLIAAIIGAVQIAIIVAVVMCITRKCPKNNRGRRQKQNLGHFSSDTNSRMV